MNGRITDIETMGLVDGPGMRLVLFLSGCNLRCVYCHNPETWNLKDFTREISSDEVLKLFNKNKVYYGDVGGVTFSGGEPLIQRDFVFETMKLLKENNVHIVLDTAGAVDCEYDDILDLVDLVILDIKAVKEDEYKAITGLEMTYFNRFVERVKYKNKKLWLRQVIVPGINDDEEHVELLSEFAKNIPNVERIELLPYHSMGKSKYEKLGIPYRLNKTPDMDKEQCKKLQDMLKF